MGEAHEFKIKRAGGGRTSYVLSSQGISKATRYRQRTIRWEKIRTLWILRNSFILFYSDTSYWVLPADQIPEKARAFLMDRVEKIGVRTKSLG